MQERKASTMNLSEDGILAFLKKIAEKELELTAEQMLHFNLDTPIVEGLQLDSVAQVVLITAIEERYQFFFDPESSEKIETVRDLVKMIQRQAQDEASRCQ